MAYSHTKIHYLGMYITEGHEMENIGIDIVSPFGTV
jgi:hypothetical protein